MKLRCLVAIAWGLAGAFACAPANAECVVRKLAELPVTMLGLRPTVPVKINQNDARMLVDSGAFFSFISPGSAAQFGLTLQPLPASFSSRGYNGDVEISLTNVKTLLLAGQTLNNVDFLVGGSEMGSAGLIGQNILALADVEFDLPDGAIRIMKSRNCDKTNMAYWAADKPWSLLPIEAATPGSHITGTVAINGVKIHAIFDTGAPMSILSLAAAERAGVKPGGPGVVAAGSVGGAGRKTVETWIAPFDSLQIGDNETIQKIRLRFGAGYAGDGIDMLIGADFFLSHRVYVANSQRKLFFSYVGGPVFNLTTGGPASAPATAAVVDGPEPTDADGFSRRAQVAAARRDYPRAIADLTRAISLAPMEPRYLNQRATAYLNSKQMDLAMGDVDRGLKLKPDDLDMLMLRTRMRFMKGDTAAIADLSAADLDAADRAAAPQADQRFALGTDYIALIEDGGKADYYDRALKQFELWLKYHPDDLKLPEVLNSRCWLRAITGRELDKALTDCNRSLRLRPKMAGTLDSRELVQLRLSALALAIADYDAALALNPRVATSLYGRGLAKQRRGDDAGGKADIAAAMAIDPKVANRFGTLGITPAAGATN